MKRTRWIALVVVALLPLAVALAGVPEGFTPLWNGKDLTGWHISKVNHHGTSQGWAVKDGILTATQDKPGNGGILLTDKKYGDFEVSLEIKPDFGCDGGLFLRSNEKGQAYQVMIDYLEGGSVGGIYGEGLKGVSRASLPTPGRRPGARGSGTPSGRGSRARSRTSRSG